MLLANHVFEACLMQSGVEHRPRSDPASKPRPYHRLQYPRGTDPNVEIGTAPRSPSKQVNGMRCKQTDRGQHQTKGSQPKREPRQKHHAGYHSR